MWRPQPWRQRRADLQQAFAQARAQAFAQAWAEGYVHDQPLPGLYPHQAEEGGMFMPVFPRRRRARRAGRARRPREPPQPAEDALVEEPEEVAQEPEEEAPPPAVDVLGEHPREMRAVLLDMIRDQWAIHPVNQGGPLARPPQELPHQAPEQQHAPEANHAEIVLVGPINAGLGEEGPVQGVEIEEVVEGPPPPQPLPVPEHFERKKALPFKHQVLRKGVKRKQVANCDYAPEDAAKPIFVVEPHEFKPVRRSQRIFEGLYWEKLFQSKAFGEVDEDLLAELWLEAAFQPRSPRLALQLKNKAKRYMADWDLSLYTSLQVTSMIIRAVGAAMTISPWEEEVRHLLSEVEVNKLIHDQAKFCKGDLKCPTFRSHKTLPGTGQL